MPHQEIPANPEEITPEWLTESLRSGGVLSDASVISLEMETFGESGGFVGEVVRLKLRYDLLEYGAPRSVVAKFPSADQATRANLNGGGAYEREVRFYQEIAGNSVLKMPQLYYGATDPVANNHVLLLEDIDYARRGDVLKGCTAEEAELVARHLARFQATWWNSPALDHMDWMQGLAKDADEAQESFKQLWALCLRNLGDKIPPPFQDIVQKSSNHVAEIRAALGKPPQTVTHGDYRLDNMFFGDLNSDSSLIVIDWQFATIGRGAGDVAWFMMYCMPPEQRRNLEKDVLKAYHSTLVENGVREYTFEQCLHDYRLSMLQLIQRIIPAGAHLDFTNERGSAVISQVFERTSAALVDLNVEELLPTTG